MNFPKMNRLMDVVSVVHKNILPKAGEIHCNLQGAQQHETHSPGPIRFLLLGADLARIQTAIDALCTPHSTD